MGGGSLGWGDGGSEEETLHEGGNGGVGDVGEVEGVTEEVVNAAVEEGKGGGWGGGGGEEQGGGEEAAKLGVRPSGTGGGKARGWAHRKP